MSEGYCRDCLTPANNGQPHSVARCPSCGSPRIILHPEINTLSLAHIDCDAFFAAVEKLDNPELRDKPVIVGGGQRGVVSTCCYIARIHGVHSAMPMFTARKLCPDAVIVKPRMARYVEVGTQIRERMRSLTPLVEPLSIDEAFLDLTGTERLHGGPPALTLLKFAQDIEAEIGVSVSVGLSHNKSMAKMASDLDKPRGFSVIGQEETLSFLAPMPVRALFGVGAAMARSLEKAGYHTLADLQTADRDSLWKSLGDHGAHLHDLARGIDPRPVKPGRRRKSVSSERTFNEDVADYPTLRGVARKACERVSSQLKAKGFAGRVVTLKVKTNQFKTLTRAHTLPTATQSADRMFRTVEPLLQGLATGTAFRLLGVGISELVDASEADDRDLADMNAQRRTSAENAMDQLRAKFGEDAVNVGLMFEVSDRGEKSADAYSQTSARKGAKSAKSPRSVNDP